MFELISHTCKIFEDQEKILLYEGWCAQGDLLESINKSFEHSLKLTGEFFVCEINKIEKTVKALTDRRGSFILYYCDETQMISTNQLDFPGKPSNDWFRSMRQHQNMNWMMPSDLPARNNFRHSRISTNNQSAVENAKYVPPGYYLTYNGQSKFDLFNYWDRLETYCGVEEDINDYEQLKDLVYKKLWHNVKNVMNEYPGKNIFLGGSTGLDSMTVLQCLNDNAVPYTFLNYHITECVDSSACFENSLKLARVHKSKGIKHINHAFSTNSFTDYIIKYRDNINHINFGLDILYDSFCNLENTTEDDLILKGTWGDESFWHNQHCYLLYLKSKGFEYEDAIKQCQNTYLAESNRNPSRMTKDQFDSCKNDWWLDAGSFYYGRIPNYITSERQFSNRLAFAPFADEFFINIILRCKTDQLKVKCMLGDLQKDLIKNPWSDVLNQNKDGEQSAKALQWTATYDNNRSVSFYEWNKFCLETFYRNIQAQSAK